MNDKLLGLWLKVKANIYLFGIAWLLTAMLNAPIPAQKRIKKAPARQLEQVDESNSPKKVSDSKENKEETNRSSKPKVVMVTDFDARGILPWWKGNWDIGTLFSNSIIGPLSRVESYEVAERDRMKEIFAEQGLSGSELFSQPKITKVGRLLGADYILFGSLQDFSRKKGKNPFIKETQVSIRLSARLVSIATGKVFKSAEINYLSKKEKDYFSLTSKELDPYDPEFLQSIFGKAITEAAAQTVSQLTGEVESSPVVASPPTKNAPTGKPSPVAVTENGFIADVTGNTVIINLGSLHGVKPGIQFAVVQIVKEVRDPKNPDKIIFRKTEELARIKITIVESAASEGTLVSGKPEALKVGTEVIRVN
jgi:curli biogenesis system outer membrane secretion channel CsgG